MNRAGNLWPNIVDRNNLRLAFSKATRHKKASLEVRQFAANLDGNLDRLARGLNDGTCPVGQFHQFVIHDPKERVITAPCFAERVLHHALTNITEPIFERWLIDDTYACRRGRGRITALLRAQQFARQYPFFLKLDIRKYFDSVSHDELLRRLSRLFKGRRVLNLYERIVTAFRGDLGNGLPIGSLTSQHLANFYLGWFDRFVKESLRVRGYVRYMDDMAIWATSSSQLRTVLAVADNFLGERLRLKLKPKPFINRASAGMEFLGCRIFSDYITLTARSRRRFQRKIARLERSWLDGEIGERELQSRGTALVAFTRTAGLKSWRFRQAVLKQMPVSGHLARTA